MYLEDVKSKMPTDLFHIISKDISKLRPSQEKAITAGLLNEKNLLVCTPTASGKTLIGEMAMIKGIMEGKGKAVYIAPLKSLATEKFRDFKKRYEGFIRVGLSIGDLDSADGYLNDYDLIVCTSEKLDSLIRHNAQWLRSIATLVIDEIHLLNDLSRGPTLEVIITLLRDMIKLQIIGLSATIGNPSELAAWLDAELVEDSWRPVKLKKGVAFESVEFYE